MRSPVVRGWWRSRIATWRPTTAEGYYAWAVWPLRCADAERIPWFDAAYHDRFVLHGAGYEARYLGGLDAKEHGIESDDYMTTEVLTGHPAMVPAAFGRGVRGRVGAWEPWNEPDIAVFSEDPADQVAALQKAAYLGFKAADPAATVLMVSLAHPPGAFIEAFLENETGPYFDVYNYHTYDPLGGYERRAAAHAEVRSRFGIAAKPVWVTEAGIPIKTPSGDLSPEEAARQAEFVPKSYVLSLAHGASRHFFFILPHYIEHGVQFGLLERDLEPGPGYASLAALASALGDAREPRELHGLPELVTGWLFSRGDGLLAAALWARAETALSLPPGVEARDLYGRALAKRADGLLPVAARVAYVIGKPESFQAWKPAETPQARGAGDAAFTVPHVLLRFAFPADRADKAKEAWRAAGDGTLAGELQVYNFSREEFAGSVRLSGAPGLSVEPAVRSVRVEADGRECIEVKLRWDAGEEIRRVKACAVRQGPPAGEEDRSSVAIARVREP
jgi:hypothetical protein